VVEASWGLELSWPTRVELVVIERHKQKLVGRLACRSWSAQAHKNQFLFSSYRTCSAQVLDASQPDSVCDHIYSNQRSEPLETHGKGRAFKQAVVHLQGNRGYSRAGTAEASFAYPNQTTGNAGRSILLVIKFR